MRLQLLLAVLLPFWGILHAMADSKPGNAISSTAQTQAWCRSHKSLFMTAELVQAARVCNGTSSENSLNQNSQAWCGRCQCRLSSALLPVATALLSSPDRPATWDSSLDTVTAARISTSWVLYACMDMIIGLWGSLPGPSTLAPPGALVQGCTWQQQMVPGACLIKPDTSLTNTTDTAPSDEAVAKAVQVISRLAVNQTSDWLVLDGAGPPSTTDTMTWAALCACASNSQDATLCDPDTLLPYTSACHAKCMGVQDVQLLVPCFELFNDTSTPTNSHAVDSDEAGEYHYEADVSAVTDSDVSPSVLEAMTAPRLVATHNSQQAASTSVPNTTISTIRVAASDGGTGRTAGQPSDGVAIPVVCPWSAPQLYQGLGGAALPAYIQDCQAAACLIGRLAAAAAAAAAMNQSIPAERVLHACVPELALVLLMSGGSTARSAAQALSACAVDELATPQGCNGAYPAIVLPTGAMLPTLHAANASIATARAPPSVDMLSNSSRASSPSASNQTQPATAAPVNEQLMMLMKQLEVLRSNYSSQSPTLDVPGSSSPTASAYPDVRLEQQSTSADITVGTPPEPGPTADTQLPPDSPVWSFHSPFLGLVINVTAPPSGGEVSDAQGSTETEEDGTAVPAVRWPGLCACNRAYQPVCHRVTLKWFPSPCYAKCQGAQIDDIAPCPEQVTASTPAGVMQTSPAGGNGAVVAGGGGGGADSADYYYYD